MSSESDPDVLPVHVYIRVIGGKWKPEILWFLRKGPLRFGELMKKVPGITQVTLTKNLRELEADGIVIRTVFPEIPPRVEYRLTEFGESVFPVLDVISAWGRRYVRHKKDMAE
ncbi:transcriptional regulator [Methanofollis aquaemaris]|uniref:Transcriptional regulator n=1 Tax=Methanofollis aquaemaris TaxID=126734 RepID=A0A8A3S3Y6_9EURY|nr:helix-turn-helix domain-containing protein [Methanofollis aquaemaris]QSZ66356.1 transcriptional regulator [Methanofollis aquaemaris]